MPIWNDYLIPHSLEESIKLLNQAPQGLRLIAGGTDLLLDIQQGRIPTVETLVDVNEIPDLQKLELRGDSLFIGAAVPLKKITSSPLVKFHAEALAEAAGLIGGTQIRNSATLGGNVAHALPAADGTIGLLALNAKAEVAHSSGSRSLALIELFAGPGQSTLDPQREILVGFSIPVRKMGQSSAFARIMRPQGIALPILNMAIWLERIQNRVQDVRITLGPAGPIPQRCIAAEKVLFGKIPDEELKQQAIDAIIINTTFRTSPYRSTSRYRKSLCKVLFNQVFDTAWKRAIEQVAL